MFKKSQWIWQDEKTDIRNRYVEFYREFDYFPQGEAKLSITCDSRYFLYLNGDYIGEGPIRAYPENYKYDTYDVSDKLKQGKNILTVLACHFGECNLQYIYAPAGLLLELCNDSGVFLVSDKNFSARENTRYQRNAPKVSFQNSFFEEQYDANIVLPEFKPVYVIPSKDNGHKNLEVRDIPFLSETFYTPKRLVACEAVKNDTFIFSCDPRELLVSPELNSEFYLGCFAFVFNINVENGIKSAIEYQEGGGQIFLNGEELNLNQSKLLNLKKGINRFCLLRRGIYNNYQTTLCFKGIKNADITNSFFIGPMPYDSEGSVYPENEWGSQILLEDKSFKLNEAEHNNLIKTVSECDIVSLKNNHPELVKDLTAYVHGVNVFAENYCDFIIKELPLQKMDDLTVETSCEYDTRLLFDFGGEKIGYLAFECECAEDTVLDFHNFEFIQSNGLRNYAEGMNNTMRYTARKGTQSYRSLIKRGLRYMYITIRKTDNPVKLKNIGIIETVYPQAKRGCFDCSDNLFNKIYEVSLNTLRCCSLDTYVDCPTYEQVFWVGDARNEALVDWVANGDSRLWFRCLKLAGQSLQRSPLVQSHLPSGWSNIISAWSCMWQQSCYEYLLYTGDYAGIQSLLPMIHKNIEGIEQHINDDGLFYIDGWNMFDWAGMDTPRFGVVTHQNCFVIIALDDTIKLLQMLGDKSKVQQIEDLRTRIVEAINKHLYSEEEKAYTDCLRYLDGKKVLSKVFSQQTQILAYLSGVARGAREVLCKDYAYNPPSHFVKSGSPFFEFFRLAGFCEQGRFELLHSEIKRNWGFMIDEGCDTFWEMWSGIINADGRLTRSHCHAWSSAPAYYLVEYVLGVRPLAAGYTEVLIQPNPGSLEYCRGSVPTPYGVIKVEWSAKNGVIQKLDYTAPKGVKVFTKDDLYKAKVT